MSLKENMKKGVLSGLEEMENVEERSIEKRDIEKRSIENVSTDNSYNDFKKVKIRNSRNGNKYKANFSLNEETMQKIQHLLLTNNFNLKENSKIPEFAVNLLYDAWWALKEKGINIFDLTFEEIVKEIRSIEL